MGTVVKIKGIGKGIYDFFIWFSSCGVRKVLHWFLCTSGKKPPLGRRPSSEEKKEYEGSAAFPNLKTWSVTGESDGQYNCIAWSLGITNAFIWPGYTVKDFDAFYAKHGRKVSSNCDREYKKRKVALYGANPGDCRHASRETHDCGWHESKLGGGIRIMHNKKELEGGQWGNILRCYEKQDQNANLDLC